MILFSYQTYLQIHIVSIQCAQIQGNKALVELVQDEDDHMLDKDFFLVSVCGVCGVWCVRIYTNMCEVCMRMCMYAYMSMKM